MRRGQYPSDLPDRVNVQRRAAQYVRVSTEHQKYSIPNQVAAIAEYAATRYISIVKTYDDPAKSGLGLEGREGLKSLIADVKGGQSDFDSILVYDVSRWGRFQDIDESAYYEFICKQAGIAVHYCAEQFDNNDGSLTASVLKSIKRAMAGEYSRELSVKLSQVKPASPPLASKQADKLATASSDTSWISMEIVRASFVQAIARVSNRTTSL